MNFSLYLEKVKQNVLNCYTKLIVSYFNHSNAYPKRMQVPHKCTQVFYNKTIIDQCKCEPMWVNLSHKDLFNLYNHYYSHLHGIKMLTSVWNEVYCCTFKFFNLISVWLWNYSALSSAIKTSVFVNYSFNMANISDNFITNIQEIGLKKIIQSKIWSFI